MKEIFEFAVTDVSVDTSPKSLYETRKTVSSVIRGAMGVKPDVTIMIQGYNRLEKTKECVESVLKYTKGINYNLLLVDNGSTDGTFEYFNTVEHDDVKIIRISRNIMVSFSLLYIDIKWIADYFVPLPNDIIVTENWLKNLLAVFKSDPKIGMVNPISSNASNFQDLNFEYSSMEELQKKAAQLNVSDPKKWHERLRLVTLGTVYSKECLLSLGFPHIDLGFFHDFGDDDITFRVRRAGYKAILAKDTWIHHNHVYSNMDEEKTKEFNTSIQVGQQNFRDKYFGVDAWEDVNNYPVLLYPYLGKPSCVRPKILGVDVRCGTPILELKNSLREFGVMDADMYAYTQDGKYFIDLQTICTTENVACGVSDNIMNTYSHEMFDYIIVDKCINTYPNPEKLIANLYSLLKTGGQLFIYLKNSFDIFAFLNLIGYRKSFAQPHVVGYTVDDFFGTLNKMGLNAQLIGKEAYDSRELPQSIIALSEERLKKVINGDFEEAKLRLITKKFAFKITR